MGRQESTAIASFKPLQVSFWTILVYAMTVKAVSVVVYVAVHNDCTYIFPGGGTETATVAAASVVVVLVVLILALSGVVIAVLVLKHRQAAPPLTQQPPTM